jgi:hypothetical protein
MLLRYPAQHHRNLLCEGSFQQVSNQQKQEADR